MSKAATDRGFRWRPPKYLPLPFAHTTAPSFPATYGFLRIELLHCAHSLCAAPGGKAPATSFYRTIGVFTGLGGRDSTVDAIQVASSARAGCDRGDRST